MDLRTRARALGVALFLLVLLDVMIARFDVFTPLVGDTLPTTLFAKLNVQVIDLVRTLERPPAAHPLLVLIGNSQTDMATRPLGVLEQSLVAAGARHDVEVVSLCVYGTAVTDAEVVSRGVGRLAPRIVVLGLSPLDLGFTVERSRAAPVIRLLDVGLRDGVVPPADLEARLDRMVRTVWRLYRYRSLFRELLLPPAE